MFTKPSIADLVGGITANVERSVLPALGSSAEGQLLVDALAVLDRLAAEWHTAAAHLVEDNTDISLTLDRLGRSPSAKGTSDGASDARSLAEQNCRLKSALIATIEQLDLPATPGDPAAKQDADREVRELLARMLRREVVAHPATEPRQNPLSKAVSHLPAEVSAEMGASLERFIAAQEPGAQDVRVTDFDTMAGGASREAFQFDASWTSPDGPVRERCVLLRQPISSVLESDESASSFTGSRRVPEVEFKMLRAMESAGIPVPHMLWVETDGAVLERPFMVSRLVGGEPDPAKLAGAPHAQRVLEDYVKILARLHTLDPAAAGIDFLGDPTPENAASLQVEQFANSVEQQRLEEFPALVYLIRWLRKNLPNTPRVSIVHGDFRLGNFLYDDNGICAMLDWEQTHLGDPIEEIAFMYWPLWSLEPFIPLDQLIKSYEAESGIHVDPQALWFHRAFIELKMSVVLLTGIRAFFATDERQLPYGTTMSLQLLNGCQLRFMEELIDRDSTEARGEAS